jgi:hypothetical protein
MPTAAWLCQACGHSNRPGVSSCIYCGLRSDASPDTIAAKQAELKWRAPANSAAKSRRIVRRLALPSLALVVVLFVAAWSFAIVSPQYRAGKAIINTESVVLVTGPIRFFVLTGFRVSSVESATSNLSFYVVGEGSSGALHIELVNSKHGPQVTSATLRGKQLHVAPAAS